MNPSTIWHLFTADVRRLRWLIIAVLVFLLIEAGQFYFNDPWNLPSDTTSFNNSLPEYLRRKNHFWISLFSPLAAVLAATLGWQGATAAKLRPVRRREIVVSKFASLVLFLYVPQMLAILLVLTRHGIPFNQAALGMAAAAGAFVPLWIILAAYGRLAGTMWRFLGAAGVTIAVLGVLAAAFRSFERGPLTVLSLVCNDGWGRYAGPMAWSILWSSALLMLALTAFTIRRWKPFWRCTVAAIGVFAITFGMRNVDWFTLKPSTAAKEFISQKHLEGIQLVMPEDFRLQENRQPKFHTLRVSGQIQTQGLPPGVFCSWMSTEDSRLFNHGRQISEPSAFYRNRRPKEPQIFAPFAFRELSEALLRAFPENELLRNALQRNISLPLAFPRQEPNWQHAFVFSPTESFQNESQFNMDLEMTGTLYRYEVIVDVPFVGESTVPCLDGWLQVKTLPDAKSMGRMPPIGITFQSPTPGIAEHVVGLHHGCDLQNLWKPMLYLPERGDVFPSMGHSYYAKAPLLSGGATHRLIAEFGEISHFHPDQSRSQHLASARLLILQPVFLGTVTRHFAGEAALLNFVPSQSDSARMDLNYARGPRMAPNEALAYARPRRPNPETASAEQMGRWLQLIGANSTMSEWLSAEYAAWAPINLDLFLRCTGENFYPVARALAQSMPESQKSAVIAELEEYPELIEVLQARGWLEDAREPLLRLYAADKFRREEHLCILASLGDPSTYDRLLRALEGNGDERLYNVLRQKPGIEPRLSESVNRLFAKKSVDGLQPIRLATYEDWNRLTELGVPLMHGKPEAMRDALILFQWFKLKSNSGLVEFMARHFQLPQGNQRDSREVIDYLMSLKQEDCQWDPLIRRWVATES